MNAKKNRFIISCSKDAYTGKININAELIPVIVKFRNPKFDKTFQQILKIKETQDKRIRSENDASNKDQIRFESNRKINSLLMSMDENTLNNFYSEYLNN